MDQIWPGAVDVLGGWSSLEPRLEVGIPSDLKIYCWLLVQIHPGSNNSAGLFWFICRSYTHDLKLNTGLASKNSFKKHWDCREKKSFSRSQQFLGLRSTVFHLKATEGGLYRMTTTTGQFATGWRWSMMRNLSLSWRMMSSASRDG